MNTEEIESLTISEYEEDEENVQRKMLGK